MKPLNRAALFAMLLLFVSCSTAQPAGQVTKPAQIVKPLNDAQRVASGFSGGVFLLDGETGDVFATNEQWLVRAAKDVCLQYETLQYRRIRAGYPMLESAHHIL